MFEILVHKVTMIFSFYLKFLTEKVYFMSQILERPSFGEYKNITGVPVLPENVTFNVL